MKIEIFTEGIGRVIASGYAMRNCISFIKYVYPKRFRWIKRNGIDFDMVYAVNYILRDQWIESIEIDEADEEAALGYPNCPNCANQVSIAAPGQTVLCKTHDKENEERLEKQHYAEMKEFFIEEIERITFRPHLPFCSCCGKQTSQYVGIIQTNSSGPLSFSFCIDCRDELTLKQNAARAAQERIGA